MPTNKEKTKVQLAQVHSKSLRTTIPAGIVRQFAIEEGTELEWEISPKDNQLLIVVRPVVILDHPVPESGADKAGEPPANPRAVARRAERKPKKAASKSVG